MKWTKRLKRRFYVNRDRVLANLIKDQEPALSEDLQTYCLFMGHPRSSHSLVGSLVDAHPNALLAHEQDTLKYIHEGFSREQLYALLARNARQIGKKGRTQTGYSYVVPGQYQGTWTNLQVIGDKRGGNTARWLYEEPHLLSALRNTIQEQIRVIYVTRNPFDNIATMVYRPTGGRPEKMTQARIQKEQFNYLAQARVVEQVRQELGEEAFCHIAIENFLENPEHHLHELMHFLGLPAHADYMEACAGILFKQPRPSRWNIQWPEATIDEVATAIQDLPCLAGYRFED